MSDIKTTVTDADVEDFINSVENDQRRSDAFEILSMYKRVTGLEPKMWGPSMIGFGSYHYKSDRSSQEADWPLAAFSPRKANQTLYVYPDKFPDLLEGLGKFKTSVSCLYISKLDDIDRAKLEKLIGASYQWSIKEFVK